jgi:Ca2+-binding EF-hand superfamily protein
LFSPQVAKNDGRITFAHFARILNYIGIVVSTEDFNLLVRRFIKDSYTLDYVEFLKAVEAVKKEGIRGLGVVSYFDILSQSSAVCIP